METGAASPSASGSVSGPPSLSELEFGLLCMWYPDSGRTRALTLGGGGASDEKNQFGQGPFGFVPFETLLRDRSPEEGKALDKRASEWYTTHCGTSVPNPIHEDTGGLSKQKLREQLLEIIQSDSGSATPATAAGVFNSSIPLPHLRACMVLSNLELSASAGGESLVRNLRKHLPTQPSVFAPSLSTSAESQDRLSDADVMDFSVALLILSTWRAYQPALLIQVEEWILAEPSDAATSSSALERRIAWLLEALLLLHTQDYASAFQAPSSLKAVQQTSIRGSPSIASVHTAWSLLLGQLLRGRTGVVRKRPRPNDPSDSQSWRREMTRRFAHGVHNYVFSHSIPECCQGASRESSISSLLAYDAIVHSLLPSVLTQSGMEWIWEVWHSSLRSGVVSKRTAEWKQRLKASTSSAPEDGHKSSPALAVDSRISLHPDQAVADIILQLQSASYKDRVTSAVPPNLIRFLFPADEGSASSSAAGGPGKKKKQNQAGQQHQTISVSDEESFANLKIGDTQWKIILSLSNFIVAKTLTLSEVEDKFRQQLAPLTALCEALPTPKQRESCRSFLYASSYVAAVVVASLYRPPLPSLTQHLLTLIAPALATHMRHIPKFLATTSTAPNSSSATAGHHGAEAATTPWSIWASVLDAVYQRRHSIPSIAAAEANPDSAVPLAEQETFLGELVEWTLKVFDLSLQCGPFSIASGAPTEPPNSKAAGQLFGLCTVNDVQLVLKDVYWKHLSSPTTAEAPAAAGQKEFFPPANSVLRLFRTRHYLRFFGQSLRVHTSRALTQAAKNASRDTPLLFLPTDDTARALLRLERETWNTGLKAFLLSLSNVGTAPQTNGQGPNPLLGVSDGDEYLVECILSELSL